MVNHRGGWNDNNILLSEFKFYNNTKKIIDNEELKKIQEQLIFNPGLEQVYWTNDVFAKQGVGFEITRHFINSKPEFYISIIENKFKFKAKEFNNCKHILLDSLFITCDLTDFQENIISNFYPEENCDFRNKSNILNSWDEILNFLIENKIIDKWYESPKCWEEYKKIMNELFPNTLDKKSKYEIIKKNYHCPIIKHIIKVIEKRINDKNYRIAFINHIRNVDTIEEEVMSIPEDNENYNYIDEGRIFLIPDGNTKYFFLDTTLNEYINEKLIINFELFYEIDDNVRHIFRKNEKVITPMIYRFYKDRLSQQNINDRLNLTSVEIQIIEQYKKLLKKDKTIKIDNVTISRTRITVDEHFDMNFKKTFLNVIDNISFIKKKLTEGDMRYNFNSLYEELLRISSLRIIKMDNTHSETYKNFNKMGFMVNGIKISLEKENNRIKINGVFCRIADVTRILSRAICYNNQQEFNRYIKEVSHIGMDWKLMINTGISLEIRNPFRSIFNKIGEECSSDIFIRFSLLWDSEKRQKVYLLLNNKKYLIKYKGKFKRHFNYPRKMTNMRQLKLELSESIEKLDDDTFLEIIENASEESKIIKERGAKLVKETIKEISAELQEIEVRGHNVKGYLIKGKLTGADYFVEGSNLEVYKKIDGVWNRRCVVDDPNKNRIFEDRLANRLINIANEPKRIFTLFN